MSGVTCPSAADLRARCCWRSPEPDQAPRDEDQADDEQRLGRDAEQVVGRPREMPGGVDDGT
jgi:hypothetical protein